jgi:hypothetical protein
MSHAAVISNVTIARVRSLNDALFYQIVTNLKLWVNSILRYTFILQRGILRWLRRRHRGRTFALPFTPLNLLNLPFSHTCSFSNDQ